MKISVSDIGNVPFLSAKLGRREQINPRELEMITAQAVPELLRPSAVQGRRNNIVRYSIQGLTTLTFYLTCVLNLEQFADLLLQSTSLFRRMHNLHLDYRNLLFDYDEIFIDMKTRRINYTYIPLQDSKRSASIPDFFKKLITTAGYSTYEQADFNDRALSFLARPVPFSLHEFESFVRSQLPQISEVEKVKPYEYSRYESDVNDAGYKSVQNTTGGGTVLLGKAGAGTDILVPMPPAFRGYLIQKKTNMKIVIDRDTFRIGKAAGQVDFCISDNNAVSRVHAEITRLADKFLLTDKNSTNKTYVNGYALAAHESVELCDSDNIKLGNEELTFKLGD